MVKRVENQIAADQTLNHEYLPVAGLPAFRTAACALVLGKDNAAILENRVSCWRVGDDLGGSGWGGGDSTVIKFQYKYAYI